MLDPMGWTKEERINFQTLPKDIETGTSKDHWNHHAARHGLIEEDIAHSGDVLKLLLLQNHSAQTFGRDGRRTGWSTGTRKMPGVPTYAKSSERAYSRLRGARVDGIWWTGWRGWQNLRVLRGRTRRQIDLERLALKEKPSAELLKEKRRKEGLLRSESHSRSSSRSTTPTPEPEARHPRRRGSSSGGSVRRPKKASAATSRLSATETLLQDAEILQPLSKRASTLSTSSKESDEMTVKKEESAEPEIKQEPAEV